MTTKASEERSTAARARAEASFKKEERAKDGALAMMEYLANARMVRERTERLRALRLAKQEADKEHEVPAAAEQKQGREETLTMQVASAHIGCLHARCALKRTHGWSIAQRTV